MNKKRDNLKSKLAKIYMDMDDYTPNELLDLLKKRLVCHNDASLSRHLKITPPMVAKLRGRDQLLTSGIIVAILDNSDLRIHEVRQAAGLPANWQEIAKAQMLRLEAVQ